MTLSPKYVSNFANCTAPRGADAKDIELAQAHLDVTTSNWSQCRAESSAEAERDVSSEAPPPPPRRRPDHDDAASYLQVVVEKHRRRREVAAAQTSPRLPSASSPLAYAPLRQASGGGGGDRGVYVLPHPVLLACPSGSPLCKALQTHNLYTGMRGTTVDAATGPGGAGGPAAGDAPSSDDHAQKKDKSWKIFRDMSSDKLYDDEPERVEVYYFEQGAGAWLATSGGGRATRVEAAARRPARALGALLAEALAVPALAARGALAAALAVTRALLEALRGAVSGAVQTGSDYALKPALALLFNALVQPLLVFAANVGRGVRAALRPLAGALGDALEPLAHVLAAARLVDVRLACRCERHAAL